MADLMLSSTEEIMGELKNRFDDYTFHGRKKLKPLEDGSNQYIYKMRNYGTLEACVYLVRSHEWALHADSRASEEEPEPWEEL